MVSSTTRRRKSLHGVQVLQWIQYAVQLDIKCKQAGNEKWWQFPLSCQHLHTSKLNLKIAKAEIRVKNDEGMSKAFQLPAASASIIPCSMQFIDTARSDGCAMVENDIFLLSRTWCELFPFVAQNGRRGCGMRDIWICVRPWFAVITASCRDPHFFRFRFKLIWHYRMLVRRSFELFSSVCNEC